MTDQTKSASDDVATLIHAAKAVCYFDWSDNDRDAVKAMAELRRVVENVEASFKEPVALTPFMIELNRRYMCAPKMAAALVAMEFAFRVSPDERIHQKLTAINKARAALAEYGIREDGLAEELNPPQDLRKKVQPPCICGFDGKLTSNQCPVHGLAIPKLASALNQLISAIYHEYPERLPRYCDNQVESASDVLRELEKS